jgi:hypothetical protein
MIKTDVHQHLWSAPLLDALSERSQLPFIRREHGLAILYLAGERPYVIELSGEAPARRAELVERDGLDRALVCVSSPLGIESLPREQSLELLDAYHDGALSLADPFAVWGAIALERPDADDVDDVLSRGCVGLSIPAGALAGVDELSRLHAALARLEQRGAPLFVHPGPGTRPGLGARLPARQSRLDDPLWWPALTRYVADMHAAWLAFVTAGRLRHPRLRVIFSMLAGLAPLHAERLRSRGGPGVALADPLVFYDTSSYGASTARLVGEVVGAEQVLYGSDRPVVEPSELGMPGELDWDAVAEGTDRALASPQAVPAR